MRFSILITAVLLSASTSFALSTEEVKSGVASQHAAPVAASRESLIAAARAHEERKHEEHKKEKHHGKHHGKQRKHHSKAEAKSTNAPAARVAVPVPATASKRVQARALTLQDILHELESVGEEVLPFASLLIKRDAVDEVKRLDTELTEQLLKYGLRSLKRNLAAQSQTKTVERRSFDLTLRNGVHPIDGTIIPPGFQPPVDFTTVLPHDVSPEVISELYARGYDADEHELYARDLTSDDHELIARSLGTLFKDAGKLLGPLGTVISVGSDFIPSSTAPTSAAPGYAPAQPQGFFAGIESELRSIF